MTKRRPGLSGTVKIPELKKMSSNRRPMIDTSLNVKKRCWSTSPEKNIYGFITCDVHHPNPKEDNLYFDYPPIIKTAYVSVHFLKRQKFLPETLKNVCLSIFFKKKCYLLKNVVSRRILKTSFSTRISNFIIPLIFKTISPWRVYTSLIMFIVMFYF